MQNTERPTQKTIAEIAKVTQATVSLALSNAPTVAEKTRKHVLEIAEKIGYMPDPYLSGLSAYRKRNRPAKFSGTICWLSNYPAQYKWRNNAAFNQYFEGAEERAITLGYCLEEHSLTSPGMTSKRMESILKAKNVQGILVGPQPAAEGVLDFSFKHFSSVAFGYSLVKPELHLITQQQFRSMELAFRKLISLGYRRPGLAVSIDSDNRADRNWSAAYLSEQRLLPKKSWVPVLKSKIIDPETLLKWVQKDKPDVVIAINFRLCAMLTDSGLKVPENIGFALLTVPEKNNYFSGISENPRLTGRKAVELLVDQIHRNEVGVPDVPISHLVAGTWIPGKTVRAMNE